MNNKRHKKAKEKVDGEKLYDIGPGLQLALDTATASFDESIDLAVKLGGGSQKKPINRSAAPQACPTAWGKLLGFWFLRKAKKRRRPERRERILRARRI